MEPNKKFLIALIIAKVLIIVTYLWVTEADWIGHTYYWLLPSPNIISFTKGKLKFINLHTSQINILTIIRLFSSQ